MDKNSIGVILIYVAFMAVLILPTYFSNKKKKQQKAALLENLKVGDKIITVGGIKGSITNIYDQSVEMKIDKSARMEVMKSAIDRLEKK
ncbi:preprotein translocase subunit YajC [Leptotrichia massiliensis]|jgi:preprotein translocase, yajC subunit